MGTKGPKICILTHLLPHLLPLSVSLTAVSPLPSNDAVSYSMLQLSIMWLILFSVFLYLISVKYYFSKVLVLRLLYICGSGNEICSFVDVQRSVDNARI